MNRKLKKLVFFPSDPISSYIEKGKTYDFLEKYYNPGGYFDELYCLSPWGEDKEETLGKIHYIKSSPSKFRKIIKKIEPDIVRGYGGYWCSDWVSISKISGIPTVVSVHDTNPDIIYDSLIYADAIICMSHAVKNAVLKKVPNVTSNIWVIPNRIDIELFSPSYNYNFIKMQNEKFGPGKHILHIGRKTEQKNIDTVIKSLNYIDEEVSCVFIGKGDVEKYKNIAKNEGVSEKCFFLDRVENEELPLWYTWCDCMCTPSRWEGFGYVFVEAAACEAAIVTSNIGPMNEYLINGVNAILVDNYENPEAIGEAILKAISNSEEIENMKKNARKIAYNFSENKINELEISAYEQIMNIQPNNKTNNRLRFKILKQDYKNIIMRGKMK